MTFISTAIGGCGEMKCWHEHCLNLEYISKKQFDKLNADATEIIKMLLDMQKS